jgi:hypothetical protein
MKDGKLADFYRWQFRLFSFPYKYLLSHNSICYSIGEFVPPPQRWQFPLPSPPATLPDYIPVRYAIQEFLDGNETAADAFINLAYRTSTTYRETVSERVNAISCLVLCHLPNCCLTIRLTIFLFYFSAFNRIIAVG